MNHIRYSVNSKSIRFCTGYFLSFFLFPHKKNGQEEKENEVARPVLNLFFQNRFKFIRYCSDQFAIKLIIFLIQIRSWSKSVHLQAKFETFNT